MFGWEDRHVGRWFDGKGTEIEIVKVSRHRFLVTYLRDGMPIARPWMNDQPSIQMPARYIEDAFDGDRFLVELTETGDYLLELDYMGCDPFGPEQGEEISTATVGPPEYDNDLLHECSSLFLCHERLHRLAVAGDSEM